MSAAPEDTLETTHGEYNKDMNENYQLGISVGLGDAADIIMKKAQAYFALGNDFCDTLRDISKELSKESNAKHPHPENFK